MGDSLYILLYLQHRYAQPRQSITAYPAAKVRLWSKRRSRPRA